MKSIQEDIWDPVAANIYKLTNCKVPSEVRSRLANIIDAAIGPARNSIIDQVNTNLGKPTIFRFNYPYCP